MFVDFAVYVMHYCRHWECCSVQNKVSSSLLISIRMWTDLLPFLAFPIWTWHWNNNLFCMFVCVQSNVHLSKCGLYLNMFNFLVKSERFPPHPLESSKEAIILNAWLLGEFLQVAFFLGFQLSFSSLNSFSTSCVFSFRQLDYKVLLTI